MHRFLIFLVLNVCVVAVPGQTVQIVLGNPSNATSNQNQFDNFLLEHTGFIMSYNRTRGAPNWVTWHLQASDLGPIDRTNSFRTDTKLPSSWRIKKADYNNSGYHRGHGCPSEDRSNTVAANRETFLMSNMQPQTARLNSGTWKALEGYVQNLVRQGFEAYQYAGCYGEKARLKNKVSVPTHCWKIVVVLTFGANDRERINSQTRVISVNMPNEPDLVSGWRNYRVTINEIEEFTGFDFLSTLPEAIENSLEAATDDQ